MTGGKFTHLEPIPPRTRPHVCVLPTHGEVIAAGGGGIGTTWQCDTCEEAWKIRPASGTDSLAATRTCLVHDHFENHKLLEKEPGYWVVTTIVDDTNTSFVERINGWIEAHCVALMVTGFGGLALAAYLASAL